MAYPAQEYANYDHIYSLCEAIATWLHPHAEVVIHDLATDTVIRIWNNISKRKIGDSSLLDQEIQLEDNQEVYGPYERTNWDGKRLKSISSVIKNSKGQRIGLICMNLDVSEFDALQTFLESFTRTTTAIPAAFIEHDWREQIHQALSAYLQQQSTTLNALTREQKIQAVRSLDQQHLFATRNAAQHIAQILGVSRATVYNWLKTSREANP